MSKDDLIEYFEDCDVESSELLDLLKKLDVTPRPKESRKSLIQFVAQEFSETGRFMRIAGSLPNIEPARSSDNVQRVPAAEPSVE
jgi:hypothetical protein